jgi:hypothetical protein
VADSWLSDTRRSYDTDATGYADKVRGLLDGSPFHRASLTAFAELVHDAGGGPDADVGCGPGYVTRHLNDLGVDAFGIDLTTRCSGCSSSSAACFAPESGTRRLPCR